MKIRIDGVASKIQNMCDLFVELMDNPNDRGLLLVFLDSIEEIDGISHHTPYGDPGGWFDLVAILNKLRELAKLDRYWFDYLMYAWKGSNGLYKDSGDILTEKATVRLVIREGEGDKNGSHRCSEVELVIKQYIDGAISLTVEDGLNFALTHNLVLEELERVTG